MPERIQRKRTKGWRMPEGAVYVGRPTRWGNPYRIGTFDEWQAAGIGDGSVIPSHYDYGARVNTRAAPEVVARYRAWLSGAVWEYHRCRPTGPIKPIDVWHVGSNGWPNFGVVRARFQAPFGLREIRTSLAGRDLACWCPLDVPCHADVLLELANR